jgi:hypothetical protein
MFPAATKFAVSGCASVCCAANGEIGRGVPDLEIGSGDRVCVRVLSSTFGGSAGGVSFSSTGVSADDEILTPGTMTGVKFRV